MSHFLGVVMGDNVDEQLAKFDEHIEVSEYKCGIVSEKEKCSFIDYYTKNKVNHKTFEELYELHGEAWNGNRWRKDENGDWAEYSTYNPLSKYDYYTIGGRWDKSFFTMKKSIAIANIAKKKEIDWLGMRINAEEKAKKQYEIIENAFGGSIPKLDMLPSDIKTAEDREKYNNQDSIIKAYELMGSKKIDFYFSLHQYQVPKDEFIKNFGEQAITPYAFIKNGKWHERGKMGYFGMTSNEKTIHDWYMEFMIALNNTYDNEIMTVIDCHI